MSIRAAIYDLLNDIESNVYPFFAPQETKAAYVVYTVRIEPTLTQDFTGPTEVTLVLYIYANDYDTCISLADTLFTGMDNASGLYDDKTLMLSRWVSEADSGYIPDLDKINITQEYNLKFN
jgi:hypothetical protein